MQLVAAFLLVTTTSDTDIVHARDCILIDKGQSIAGSAEDLATEFAHQRRSEPSLMRVF